ncbi:YggS family pyridoxal phosphate-dependent enzyme [uncultured Psychrobacter sp.]|uniref:YggS family pyridoxal phosphate-dependent enzyme n=1 Tax=uncultured Psychrobacter sp. TaxID=259303 RepID=UPI0025982718|nr:YggS family pyridoxal phosphate-dependent enzyme [uncultured Psychrobacter sp.]
MNTTSTPQTNATSLASKKNNGDDFDAAKLIENWQQVNEQVAHASIQATRQKDEITLLAVSKTRPAEMIATLARQGQRDFGENYLQEAIEKIQALRQQPDCEHIVWHYIGSIQRNKTRDIAEHFDWVQTLEREIIAKRLHEQRPAELPALNVLIQVNIDTEDSKSGCLPTELPDLISAIKDYERLQLRGLMIIPAKANTDAFARTNQLFDSIKREHPELQHWDTLSMGMSDDMSAAIANGSTMVRVGTAIFGVRT